MLHWFFALDNTHHVCWLTIASNDLENIPDDSNLNKEFYSGNFTINNLGKAFLQSG